MGKQKHSLEVVLKNFKASKKDGENLIDFIIRTGSNSDNPAADVDRDMALEQGELIDEDFLNLNLNIGEEEAKQLEAEWREFLTTGDYTSIKAK